MSDIKQAARWLQEGHTVRRKQYADKWWVDVYHPSMFQPLITCSDGGDHDLDCFDMLANDWEIAV